MTKGIIALLATLTASCSVAASATDTYSFSIQGRWTNPIISGVTTDGATRLDYDFDNSTTAACNLVGCPISLGPADTNTLTWGDGLSSSVIINGHNITDEPLNTPFDAAEIIYLNGTSAVDSDIFGATLRLEFVPTGGGAAPWDFVDDMFITTTINSDHYGSDDNVPDWIGNFGTPTGMAFNVDEGLQAQAELWGMLVSTSGRIEFEPTKLETSDSNGRIVSGIFGQVVPEPTTWITMLLGFAVAGFALRRSPNGNVSCA